MASSSSIFSGSSRYSADLKQVLDRAVAIASLPLTQLQRQRSAMDARSTALNSLETKFAAIQTALTTLTQSVSGASSATVADPTVLRATTSSGAFPGTYTIQVLDRGSYSTSVSDDALPTVADPSTESISSASSFQLTVDGETFTIEPESDSLNALADALNAAGAGIQATVVNLGPPGSPDYRLSIQATDLGAVDISLSDGSELLSTLTTGSLAKYRVNGLPSTPIESNSQTVTVSPGLSVSLLDEGTTTVTVALSADSIKTNLRSLVTSYNTAIDELNKNHGDTGGALTGDVMIRTLEKNLRDIAQYSGLGDVGLEVTRDGKLSLNETILNNANSTQLQAITDFLGNDSSGFIQATSDILNE